MKEQTNDDWDIKEVYDSPLRPSLTRKINEYIDQREQRGLHQDGPGQGWGTEQFKAVGQAYSEFYPGQNLGINEVCKFTLDAELLEELVNALPFEVEDPEEDVTVQIGKPLVMCYPDQDWFSILPHKDWGRKRSMFYLLSDSGPTTSFYDGPQKPDDIIAWRRSSLSNQRNYTLQTGKWYMFNNSNIHEVNDICCERRSIVVPIEKLQHNVDMENMTQVAQEVEKIS